jgi:hypothetical protein
MIRGNFEMFSWQSLYSRRRGRGKNLFRSTSTPLLAAIHVKMAVTAGTLSFYKCVPAHTGMMSHTHTHTHPCWVSTDLISFLILLAGWHRSACTWSAGVCNRGGEQGGPTSRVLLAPCTGPLLSRLERAGSHLFSSLTCFCVLRLPGRVPVAGLGFSSRPSEIGTWRGLVSDSVWIGQ